VVNTSEGSLEVGVCCADVILGEFGVLVHHNVGGEAIVDLPVRSKAVSCVAEDALCFCRVGAYASEDGRPEFQDAVQECTWSVV
jgi:hypothetical protein